MSQARLSRWRNAARAFFHPRVVTMLFFGFSAGMPILLIFSSLSLWLREAGVERSAVTFFSWAALGYSFKFVWAPLVDQMPVPVLTRLLGRRRAWILTAQAGIMTAIVWMGCTDPAGGAAHLTAMAAAAVLLGFSSATQDIVIDAYRIESAGPDLQAMMASTYIAGYRIGMLVAGAGALFLADYFGSTRGAYDYRAWQLTYFMMAACIFIGVATTLRIREPDTDRSQESAFGAREYARAFTGFIIAVSAFVSVFLLSSDWAFRTGAHLGGWLSNAHIAGVLVEGGRLCLGIGAAVAAVKLMMALNLVDRPMVKEAYLAPVTDFFQRYGRGLAWLLLALIGLYRISDIVLGVISNLFYQDLGFTKTQIASVVKTFGLFMTIAGGFLGGIFSVRFSVMPVLFAGAVLSAVTNLLFVAMAHAGNSLAMLYLVISADNLAAGIASAAFVAFLSSLTNVRFTAIQYAIFSSLMTLIPKMLSGYSGTMVDSLGYPAFFTLTALMGVPVLVLVVLSGRYLARR